MSLSWLRPSFTRYIFGQRSSATMPAGMLVTEVVAAETVAAVAAVVARPFPCGARPNAVPVIVSNAPFLPPAELLLCWGFPFGSEVCGAALARREPLTVRADRDAPAPVPQAHDPPPP